MSWLTWKAAGLIVAIVIAWWDQSTGETFPIIDAPERQPNCQEMIAAPCVDPLDSHPCFIADEQVVLRCLYS